MLAKSPSIIGKETMGLGRNDDWNAYVGGNKKENQGRLLMQ
jgi:hypothetical protein